MQNSGFSRFLLGFVLCAFLAVSVAPALAQTDSPPPEGLKLAKIMARKQLTAFLQAILANNENMKLLSADKGPDEIEPIVKDEIEKTVELHGPQWEVNLANSYEGLLTTQEMKELADRDAKKETVEKFKSIQNKAGEKMKAISMPLLQQAANETLNNIAARAEKLP